jgi:hypothetical protein
MDFSVYCYFAIIALSILCRFLANDEANRKMFIGGLNWETTDRKLLKPLASQNLN